MQTSACRRRSESSRAPMPDRSSKTPRAQPPMGGKELLLQKNASLMGHVSAQRQEINDLRKRLDALRETEIRWHDTAACVSSVWDELNQTIAFLHFKLGDDDNPVAAPALEEGSALALLDQANPFLAHMLQAYLPDDPVAKKAAVSLAEDLSATESALRERMKDTMRAAASVLRAVDQLSSSARTLPGPEETRLASRVALLKAENGRLVKELTDPKNSRFQTQVAVMLLVFEALLLAVIIARVPCMSLYLAIKRRQTPSNAHRRPCRGPTHHCRLTSSYV